jgi:hypothetical protein
VLCFEPLAFARAHVHALNEGAAPIRSCSHSQVLLLASLMTHAFAELPILMFTDFFPSFLDNTPHELLPWFAVRRSQQQKIPLSMLYFT